MAYGGSKIQTTGLVTFPCCLDKRQHTLPFFLVDRDVVLLLGFHACVHLRIAIMSPHIHQVSIERNNDFTKQIFTQYKDVFSDELGITYSVTLNPTVQPVVRPAHCIPVAMQAEVKAELDSIQNKGVITTVSQPTEWVSSMVAAHKKDKHKNKAVHQSTRPQYSPKETSLSNAQHPFWALQISPHAIRHKLSQ